MAQSETTFGRVEADGTVWVKDGDWRSVGQVVDVSADEALAFYVTRFTELASQVTLLEQRSKAGASARDLLAAIEKLVVALTDAHAVGDLNALRLRVGVVAESIAGLKDKQDAENKEASAQSLERRTSIVERVEEIALQINGSIHWRNAQKEIGELFDSWKEEQKLPHRIPKKAADELWNRFKTARQTFDRAQRAFFQTKQSADKEAKSVKTDLCEKAEALAPKGADGIGQYRSLLEEWKKAPRAARALDNQLWDRFKAAGDALYSAGSLEWTANTEAKEALLSQYQHLLSEKDADAAKRGFRELRTKWDLLGNVAKADERRINDGIRAIERHVRTLETDHLERTNPAKVALREGFAAQVEASIAQLEAQAAGLSDAAAMARIQSEIASKKEWLAAIG
ncbi:MAG: DUF349 domain-containing protein [Actinobacteria bacterium]|nr:DUF349 domain-containing protein [Actinomycetota bacterium]